MWADGGDSGAELCKWVLSQFECQLKIVKKKKGIKGFQVLSNRWVAERTLAWLGRSRRLNRDDERNPTSSAAQFYLVSGRLLLRQIGNNQIQY